MVKIFSLISLSLLQLGGLQQIMTWDSEKKGEQLRDNVHDPIRNKLGLNIVSQ